MSRAVARGELSARISSESAEIRRGKATSPLGNAGQSKKHGAHSELGEGGGAAVVSVAASGEGKEADRGRGSRKRHRRREGKGYRPRQTGELVN